MVAVQHPVIALRPPVEARYRLETGAEAQDNAEGKHHDLRGHADARQNRVGNTARNIVQHDRRHHGQPGAEHGRGADADNLADDIPIALKIPKRQPEQAAAGQIGENQDGKADELGNRGSHRGSGHPQVQVKDENRVQKAVENTAEAHADHGQHGAALCPQALIHDKGGGHQGGHQQDIGGVFNGVLLTGGSGPQEPDHGPHEDSTQHHDHRAEAQGQEKSR